MGELPAIELLEATHQFPCEYMFKAIGKVNDGFEARVVAAVREALGHEKDPPYRLRESVGGRHIAVTVEPIVQSAHEVLAVYRRLKSVVGLVILF